MTWSERLADKLAAIIGSWRFIIIQSCILVTWVTYNSLVADSFDHYPYILLNLFLSFQAAYTGPVLLMASNRQSGKDRKRAVKNLVIGQQDHQIILRMEKHIDNHIHVLREDIQKLLEKKETQE